MAVGKKFPDCFPYNFVSEILPKEAREEDRCVYRISKSGIKCREDFLSTFEEIKMGRIPHKKNINEKDPGMYSTSCFSDKKDAEYILKMLMRHNPPAILLYGTAKGDFGPSQVTSERDSSKDSKSHIDWWIYKNTDPQNYFEEVV